MTPAPLDPFAATEGRVRAWDHPLAADLLRVLQEVRAIRSDMNDLRDELREVRAEQAVAAVRVAPLRVLDGGRAAQTSAQALRRAA